MENAITKKSELLKCGSMIKPLSIIALVCTILSCFEYFCYYHSGKISGKRVYELTFCLPHVDDLIMLLLRIAPVVLFVIYIFKLYDTLKATFLVPVIFGLFSLKKMVGFLFGFGRYAGIFMIISILVFIACILALISALKGFHKKHLIIMAMSICLLYEALSLAQTFSSMHFFIDNSMYLYVFTSPMSVVGLSALYVALLLFALKNKIPYILNLSPEKGNARVEEMNPERALKLLKDKLDLDMITKEEYQAQRADIISKL